MNIERMYADRPDVWEEVSEEEFLRRTEWAGYYKRGSALEALKAVGRIRTPWAFYRIRDRVTFLKGRR